MITLSNSKVSAFDCPHYFHQRYIARNPMEKQAFLEEGTFLHEVACIYTQQLAKRGLTTDNELLESVFKELWKVQKVLPESFYTSLYHVVKSFGERFKLNLATFWKAEVGIAFTRDLQLVEFPSLGSYEAEDQWAQENGVWIHQRLDRVDLDVSGRIATITDYKSARAITSESELKRRGQGKQYAFSLMTMNPFIEKVFMVFDFIRFENAQVTLEYDAGNTSDVEGMLATFSEKINALDPENPDDWPAHQGVMCSMCSYPCPLNDESLEIPTVVQDENIALRLAQKAQALKRDAKTIEDKLKVFSKGRGPIDIGLGTYNMNTSIPLGFKPADIIKFCMDNGMEPGDFLDVSRDKTERQMSKMDDELLLILNASATGKKTPSSRFGFKKSERVKATESEVIPEEVKEDEEGVTI